jgi:hypothetical protein
MPDVRVTKSALFSGGRDQIISVALATATEQPLPETTPPLQLSIGASTDVPVKIGAADSAKISISADASASLTPIFSSNAATTQQQLTSAGLGTYFAGRNADQFLLLLELGVKAAVGATATIQYQGLGVGVDLKAGVDASYRYARSFLKTRPAGEVITDFLKDFTVPAALDRALLPDEVLLFEFGGSAAFGLNVSAGYKLAGAKAFSLGDLALQETYAFSLAGKLRLTAQFAGRFNIEVRPTGDGGWASLVVKKNDNRAFGIAAQIDAGAQFDTGGLPATANEFLEAALGLRAKNWISYFKRAQTLTDPNAVKAMLDKLASSFIDKWLGQAFQQLETGPAAEVFAKIKEALASYDALGDEAVTLFDRYYDPIANRIAAPLQDALDTLAKISSWTELRGVLDGPLGDVLTILTGGELLEWKAAGDAKIAELQARITKAKELIENPTAIHDRLRSLIATAKKEFGLDKLANLLRQADPEKLKTIADQRITGFAERLIGQTVDSIAGSRVGEVAKDINSILNGIQSFNEKFYAKLLESVKQSFALSLHAGYNKATANDALISCEVNLATPRGRALMAAAGRTRFADLLTTDDPDVIRNIDGNVVRTVSRESTVSINLTGWHDSTWSYQSIRNLVVNADQHIRSTPGGLVVSTDLDLTIGSSTKRQNEQMTTAFVLNVVGLTKAGAKPDRRTLQFPIDSIASMKASYALAISDDDTTRDELAGYLGAANALGFDTGGIPASEAIGRLLPQQNQSFGKVTVSYDVQFTPAGIQAVFSKPIDRVAAEQQLRSTMRTLLLLNYLPPATGRAEIGWAYNSPSLYTLWKNTTAKDATAFIAPGDTLPKRFAPIDPKSPIPGVAAPTSVTLDRFQRGILDLLFRIEDLTAAAFDSLLALTPPFQPAAYQNAMAKFGGALQEYDRLDRGDNTILAVLDQLIAASGVQSARNSSVTVTAQLPNQQLITKMLIA